VQRANGLHELLELLPDLAAKMWPMSHVVIGMGVCSRLRAVLPSNVAGVNIRPNRASCDTAVYTMLRGFECGVFLNTDRVHTASDVVAMLQSACRPGGWRGPEGLQLSSHFEAPKFKGLGNHGMELFVGSALPHLKRLRALDLGYNSIGPLGARILVEGLTGFPAMASTLTALSLSINVLGDSGVATIASALPRLPSIRHLDLSNNWVQVAGAEALAGGLCALKNLETLDMSKNNIKTAGLAFISAVLVELPSVTQVCLSKNSIDEHGGASISAILSQCPQIVFCDLTGNRLGPLGAAQVAVGIAQAKQLEHIDLDCNELGAEGALLFAKAFMAGCHDPMRSGADTPAPASTGTSGGCVGLRHLNLFNNRMGAEGSFHLARVLGLFRFLSSLDLGHQFMYAPGAADIAKALPKCVSLESLSLNNNFIGPRPPLLPAPCCQPCAHSGHVRTPVIIIAAAQSPSPAACMSPQRRMLRHTLRMLAILQGLVTALCRCVLALLHVNTGRTRRGHVPGRSGGSVPEVAHLKPLSQSTDRCRRSGTCRFLEPRNLTLSQLCTQTRTRAHTSVCVHTQRYTYTHRRSGNATQNFIFVQQRNSKGLESATFLPFCPPGRGCFRSIPSSALLSVSRPCLDPTLRVSKTRHTQVSKP
jgi:Ran GTPase-activating protein (RanGAP) involved in mRNA processing and transport